MKANLKIILASRVSTFFSPLIWVNLGLIALLWRGFVIQEISQKQLGYLLGIFIFLPMVFFFWGVARGRFGIDLIKRKARLRFYIFGLACGFLGLNMVYYFSQSLFRIFLVLVLTALAFAVVNFWDKISLHVGGLTAVYLVWNLLSSWQYFYFLPAIPLVAWSRIVLKRHDLAQVLEGFIIPWLVIPAGLFLLKVF
jgi:hypothetical protein